MDEVHVEYSGFDTDGGETMTGFYEGTVKEFLDHCVPLFRDWLEDRLGENPNKIFSIVIISQEPDPAQS
jgi:hypothetical protein